MSDSQNNGETDRKKIHLSSKENGKREDVLSWNDYFMAMALLTAQRSKDPKRQVGACIVNKEKKIVGLGYNGFPNGCSDDEFSWEKEEKLLYVCHAEVNAILNKNSADTKGCIMYVTLFPCNECVKCIIQAGIKEIYYIEKQRKNKNRYHKERSEAAAEKMLKAAEVKISKFSPDKKYSIILNLN